MGQSKRRYLEVGLILVLVSGAALWLSKSKGPRPTIPSLGPRAAISIKGHFPGEKYPLSGSTEPGSGQTGETLFLELSGEEIAGGYNANGEIVWLSADQVEVDGVTVSAGWREEPRVTTWDVINAWGTPSQREQGDRGGDYLYYRQHRLQVVGADTGQVRNFVLWDSHESYEFFRKGQSSILPPP